MKITNLIVVQNRPTQFDVPLYAALVAKRNLNLAVYYTEVAHDDNHADDAEIAIAPQWDHLRGLEYNARFERSPWVLWREIIGNKPSHVVIGGWYPRSHLILAILLRCSGVKVGVRSDNTLTHTDLRGLRGGLKRVLTGLMLPLFNVWHPVGSLARAYLDKLAFAQRPVVYFPYAVDVDWFSQQVEARRAQQVSDRAAMGFMPDDYVVVGVMKWVDREDPLTLVEAVLQAGATDSRIKLLLVGEGPIRAEILRRLDTAPGRVVTPGYAKYSELPLYYGMANAFVHPARSEPYGVSVQEALACGLPVLVSDRVGAAVDFVEPGRTGDIFPVGNVQRLTALLLEWANRPDAEEISTRAKNKAREWSYARTIREFGQCLGGEL